MAAQELKPGDLVIIDELWPDESWVARLDVREPELMYWGVTCVVGNSWIREGRTTLLFDLSIKQRGRVVSSFKQQLKALL